MEILAIFIGLPLLTLAFIIHSLIGGATELTIFGMFALYFFLSTFRIIFLERTYTNNDSGKTLSFIIKNKRIKDIWVLPTLSMFYLITRVMGLILSTLIFITTGKDFKEQKRIINIKKFANIDDEHNGIITEEYRNEYPNKKIEIINGSFRSIQTKKERQITYMKGLIKCAPNEETRNNLNRVLKTMTDDV